VTSWSGLTVAPAGEGTMCESIPELVVFLVRTIDILIECVIPVTGISLYGTKFIFSKRWRWGD
jgi:hypothetical protein